MDYAGNRPRANPVRSFKESIPRLSYEELELAYRRSALVFKGVNRKSRDAIRKGFRVLPDTEDRDLALQLDAQAREWMRRTGFKTKTIRALREMFVLGDGFLELGFRSGEDAASPPPRRAEPASVYNVDPVSIRPARHPDTGDVVAYLHGPNVRSVPQREVSAFAAGGKLPRGCTAIHPDRIIHFQVNSIRDPQDGYGISIIEAAYVNVVSKLAGDLAAGDILEWYAKGFFTLNIEYATPEELKQATELLEAAKNARKNYFVGSDRSKFDVKTPSVANVKPFYDNFHIEIAAALEMPTMVLLGVQKGTVTGSGTDLVEYYDDIAAFQELLLEAPMLNVLRRVLNRDDFSIAWTPLYADKQTEADIQFKRAQSAAQVFGSSILSRREAIRFLKDGELPNPDDVPDGYAPKGAQAPPVSPDEDTPPAEDEPDEGEDEVENESIADRASTILQRLAREEMARERALGEALLKEWERGQK